MYSSKSISPSHRFLIVFTIVFAGEIIFSLPFHVARFFRPTLLEVFSLTNTELGDVFGIYGLMAMLAYFPGGAIADRFSAKKLMIISLATTAFGGVVFMQVPTITTLYLLFGYWGITTILLFWAAMIKITRIWGGESTQGIAFGILDGGRGLVAATIASISVLILNSSIPLESAFNASMDKTHALQYVIAFYTCLTFIAAVLIYFIIPSSNEQRSSSTEEATTIDVLKNLLETIRQPKIIAQALIVLSAYCAYKGLDYFGLYASQVLKLDDIASAKLVADASFMRPIVAIVAGLIADKLQPSRLISIMFGVLAASYLCFIPNNQQWLLQANIFITFIFVFAVRAVYFSLLAESKISGAITGTAVGTISMIGYTPDIFFAPIAGRILDANTGIAGFTNLFVLMAAISIIGLICALYLSKIADEKKVPS